MWRVDVWYLYCVQRENVLNSLTEFVLLQAKADSDKGEEEEEEEEDKEEDAKKKFVPFGGKGYSLK
jgi:hypothetical protein